MSTITFEHAPEMEGFSGLLYFAKSPLGAFEEVRAKHGPLVRYQQPAGDVRLVFEPAIVEKLLLGSAEHVHKDLFTQQLRPIIGLGLVTNEGQSWKTERKRLAPSFQPTHLRAYATAMVSATEELLSRCPPDSVRDVHIDMMHLTLDIVVRTLFGAKVVRTSEVERLLDQAVADYRRLMMSWRMAFPAWFPFLSRIRFNRARKELRKVIEELIAERRQSPLGDDMISRLLEAKDDEGNPMSDVQLLDESVTMLLAGHETTALALTYTLHLLSREPEITARLRQEFLELTGGTRPLGFEDVGRLSFTRAVIRESMRLYPPVWATGREAVNDFDLAGHRIAKGTQLVVSPWVVHRDPRYFSDPELFKPDRWLSAETEHLPKGAYFPFGLGPRVCIGQHFAEMEAMLALQTLLAGAHFDSVKSDDLRLSPSVTLRPEGKVELRVRSRTGEGQSKTAA